MCGIVGFTGNRQAAPILLDGLSKLEYRGYDSAGLTGRAFPAQRLVSFQIEDTAPIENGRVMPENVSPTVALCRAESLPAENNPTSPAKRDSGAV